jgi:hypothetical protein
MREVLAQIVRLLAFKTTETLMDAWYAIASGK